MSASPNLGALAEIVNGLRNQIVDLENAMARLHERLSEIDGDEKKKERIKTREALQQRILQPRYTPIMCKYPYYENQSPEDLKKKDEK